MRLDDDDDDDGEEEEEEEEDLMIYFIPFYIWFYLNQLIIIVIEKCHSHRWFKIQIEIIIIQLYKVLNLLNFVLKVTYGC